MKLADYKHEINKVSTFEPRTVVLSNKKFEKLFSEQKKQEIILDSKSVLLEEKDFDLFVSLCTKWIDLLGLFDWSINFYHNNNAGLYKAYADWESIHRVGYIGLAKNWDESDCVTKEKLEEEIENISFHEVLHFLFADIHDMISEKYNREAAERVLHLVIWRLVNFFKSMKQISDKND